LRTNTRHQIVVGAPVGSYLTFSNVYILSFIFLVYKTNSINFHWLVLKAFMFATIISLHAPPGVGGWVVFTSILFFYGSFLCSFFGPSICGLSFLSLLKFYTSL
jgi:hypothetical protein